MTSAVVNERNKSTVNVTEDKLKELDKLPDNVPEIKPEPVKTEPVKQPDTNEEKRKKANENFIRLFETQMVQK
jgi:hypothetical protein